MDRNLLSPIVANYLMTMMLMVPDSFPNRIQDSKHRIGETWSLGRGNRRIAIRQANGLWMSARSGFFRLRLWFSKPNTGDEKWEYLFVWRQNIQMAYNTERKRKKKHREKVALCGIDAGPMKVFSWSLVNRCEMSVRNQLRVQYNMADDETWK